MLFVQSRLVTLTQGTAEDGLSSLHPTSIYSTLGINFDNRIPSGTLLRTSILIQNLIALDNS